MTSMSSLPHHREAASDAADRACAHAMSANPEMAGAWAQVSLAWTALGRLIVAQELLDVAARPPDARHP